MRTENGFREQYWFLSNFSESPIKLVRDNKTYIFRTGEHAFHAGKSMFVKPGFDVTSWLEAIVNAPTPNAAKKLGRSIPINAAEWDSYSYKHMSMVVYAKFTQNPDLTDALKATGDIELVELNNWGDKLWGVDSRTGQGLNQLGHILMGLRSQLAGL